MAHVQANHHPLFIIIFNAFSNYYICSSNPSQDPSIDSSLEGSANKLKPPPAVAPKPDLSEDITPGWAQDAPGSSGGRSAPGGVADSRGGEEPAWTDKGEGDASGKHQTPAENPAWLKPMEHIVKPAPLPEDGSLPVEWVYMRVANVIGVILMFLTGFVEFIAGATLTTAILALYAMCFGCFLCCVELRIKVVAGWIAKNFGFLYKSWGRITFLLLCGMLMWSMESILGWIVGAYLISLAPANVYILLKYPSLEKKAIDCECRKKAGRSSQIKSVTSSNSIYNN